MKFSPFMSTLLEALKKVTKCIFEKMNLDNYITVQVSFYAEFYVLHLLFKTFLISVTIFIFAIIVIIGASINIYFFKVDLQNFV